MNRSLQIFEDENHASMHSDRTKEGLSLFGLFSMHCYYRITNAFGKAYWIALRRLWAVHSSAHGSCNLHFHYLPLEPVIQLFNVLCSLKMSPVRMICALISKV